MSTLLTQNACLSLILVVPHQDETNQAVGTYRRHAQVENCRADQVSLAGPPAFPLYGLCWLTGEISLSSARGGPPVSPIGEADAPSRQGGILGNLLGGYASHPVETYPAWFGGSRFLTRYPYFLPCGIASGLAVFGVRLRP